MRAITRAHSNRLVTVVDVSGLGYGPFEGLTGLDRRVHEGFLELLPVAPQLPGWTWSTRSPDVVMS